MKSSRLFLSAMVCALLGACAPDGSPTTAEPADRSGAEEAAAPAASAGTVDVSQTTDLTSRGARIAPSLAREWRSTQPPKDAEGCYSRQSHPAVIETVTDQVLVRAETTDATTGARSPALYRTETNHRIVKGGDAMWIRVPCEDELTPEFIATLQRALAARALYFGPITGKMDAATQGAVRGYQAPRGLLSPVLSYRAAQELGLIVWIEK